MKLRMTMAGMMTCTAVAAVDFAVVANIVRAFKDNDSNQIGDFLALSLLGTLPMANILAAGGVMLWKSRKRAGRRTAFLLGFEWAGLVAISIFVMCTVFAGEALINYVGFLLNWISPGPPSGDDVLLVGLALSTVPGALLVPQLVPALVVGWFYDRGHRKQTS